LSASGALSTTRASGTGGACGAGGGGSTAVLYNLNQETVEAFLIETGALHLLFNFFNERVHVSIYKRKIIFKRR
jgi:hypothetical protein